MSAPSDDELSPGEQAGNATERVAELALDLLKAARVLGDDAMIAAAEAAAFAAGILLARSVSARAPET